MPQLKLGDLMERVNPGTFQFTYRDRHGWTANRTLCGRRLCLAWPVLGWSASSPELAVHRGVLSSRASFHALCKDGRRSEHRDAPLPPAR